MNLQDKIKAMIDSGFTYGQLSRIIGCSSTTLSTWIQGKVSISKRMEESIVNHITSFIQNLNNIWK